MATTTLSVLGVPGKPQTFAPKSTAGTIAAIVNQAIETDLAQSITGVKFRTVDRATETDSAQAISRTKIIAVGQTTETDAAQAISVIGTQTIGQASETDLAQAITPQRTYIVSQASETDFAQTITPSTTTLTYTSYGAPFLYTSANWQGATITLETYMRAVSGTVYARLYNVTGSFPVASSDLNTTSSTFVRLRTSALSMANGSEYRAQFAKSAGGLGEVLAAHLEAYRT